MDHKWTYTNPILFIDPGASMTYHLNLFTPETWRAFNENGSSVSGFRYRYRRIASERVKVGDIFLCYLTRLSRWCGALRVDATMYQDDTPIFNDPDPFTVRFQVTPIVALDPEHSVPITENEVWNALSMTRDHEKGRLGWTGFFRGPLNTFEEGDAQYLMELLESQLQNPSVYPLTEKERRQIVAGTQIRSVGRTVEVEVLEDDDNDETLLQNPDIATTDLDSTVIQSSVAHIGASMGFHIWVPRNNKARVLERVPIAMHSLFLDTLPLNYDDITLSIIEQIDVLWLEGRAMARAFEVEHTTAIYSGLLRMADLLAIQPNIDIRLHIVAPDERREQVLRQIRRPVFSLLSRGPLYERCSFLSYSSIGALRDIPHLSYLKDDIIVEYEESAEV